MYKTSTRTRTAVLRARAKANRRLDDFQRKERKAAGIRPPMPLTPIVRLDRIGLAVCRALYGDATGADDLPSNPLAPGRANGSK